MDAMPQLSPHQQARRKELAKRATAQRQPAQKPQVAITDLNVTAVKEAVSEHSFLLLSIKTDAGVTGIGETRAGPAPQQAVQEALTLKRHLTGQEALAAEALAHHLRQNVEIRHPGLLSAVNMALLDILGKVAKAPLYEVLGGPTRTKVRALGYRDRLPAGNLMTAALAQLNDEGFQAVVVPVESLKDVSRGPNYARRVADAFDRLRQALAKDTDFVLAGGGQLRPTQALALARALERFHLLFFDEPCAEATQASLRRITTETVVPIGLGRRATDQQAFLELLRAEVLDVLRPDLSVMSISAVRKAAALAETHYIAVAPVNRGGPLTTAAALHLAASIPNFFIQEVPVPMDDRDRRMRRELLNPSLELPKAGFFALPTGPGLGVVLNEDAVEKYKIRL
jgi:galactonate dehydratase